MNTINELRLLDIKPKGQTRLIVIWLHGLGANANDFEPVLPIINEKVSGIRYIFPNAPLKSVSVNGGMMMPAWYDIRNPDLSVDQDIDGIDESCNALEQLVYKVQQEETVSTPIVLAGFSQGGVIALSTALTRNINVLGVLALSTYLPNLPKESQTNQNSHNLLMMHGDSDPIVPLSYAQNSFEKLSVFFANHQWKTFPMDHSLCYEEITFVGEWLENMLKPD